MKAKTSKSYLVNSKTLPAAPGSRKEAMPTLINPMLATLTKEAFSDPNWIFEFKWDGIRAVGFLKNKKVQLVSRNAKEFAFRYPELSSLPKWIDAENAILDGEIVALTDKGIPSFQLLQQRMGLNAKSEIARLANESPVVYYVFDLLYCNGFSLMGAELIHRKALLKEIMEENEFLRYSDHVIGDGVKLFQKASKLQLEGIIAKHQSSLYVQKRTRDWLKIKTVLRQEVVIGGYTEPKGSRIRFGSLVVGLYRDSELTYVGHVGGGFNERSLKQVYSFMQPLKQQKSPFLSTPKTNEKVQWIKPALVCEVKFSEWTSDGMMRQPIFMGLRDDKQPAQCVMEVPS